MLKTCLAIAIVAFASFSIASETQELSPLETLNKSLSPLDQLSDLRVLTEATATEDTFNFSATIQLGNCSASLVKLKDRNYKKALLLTNGHCVSGMQKDGEVVINERSRLSGNLLDENARRLGRVRATRILYAAMTRTDMALVELSTTYEEIKEQFGIEPLVISEDAPVVGDPIHILSGYWKRGFSCEIENIVFHLTEGNKWNFYDSIGYSKACVVYGGTSGSPVVSQTTNEVIGVNNSGNQGDGCSRNTCEIDEDGTVLEVKNKGYAQNTFWIYNCLDESSPETVKWNFDNEDCKLLGPE